MAGMDDAAILADASSRTLPEDDSLAETQSKFLWPESAGPAGLPVSLELESATPPGISIELVNVLKQIEEMKIAMEKLQAENQKMKMERAEAPPAETPSKSLWPESAAPAGLPVSLEPESANPPGSAQHWPEKSIYSGGASYYHMTPQKSAGAWKDWSHQGWVDWKGGTEGSATPLADRWFQSKTDPWTEAQPWCRPESQMRGREAWTGWPQSTWDARNDEALPPNQWDPNGWPRASWLPPRVEVAGWSRPPPNAWSGWCGWSSQWLKPPDRKDVKGPEIYSGDITRWMQWSKAFARYLRRRDSRWPELLEKI